MFLVIWILAIDPKRKVEVTGLSLVLGGAIGNLWDRIYLGYVVDFIDWFSTYNMVSPGLTLKMAIGNKDNYTKKIDPSFNKYKKIQKGKLIFNRKLVKMF